MKAKGKVISSRHIWKPTEIPAGFVLVIDTREQIPFFADGKLYHGIPVRKALHDGDYSVLGFEDKLCVERKQMGDFLGYVGMERHRTVQKLEWMKKHFWAGLVVEASLEDVMSPQLYGGRLTPEHIRGFLTSLNVRYGIHSYFNRDREACERWVLDRLVKGFRVLREV